MKPNFFNSLFRLIGKVLPVQFAKDQQGMKPLGSKRQIARDGTHETCALDAAGSPGEKETAALVAYDLGDPSALNELVKQGYVFGTLEEIREVWHKISMRDAGFPGKREAVANSAPAADAREAALANAADSPVDGGADAWIKIAPYGTYPGTKPGRPQHFSESEANEMVAEFHSLRGKAGRLFRGVPIYIGHPDANPEIYTDHRRLGKLVELQVRPDGLYGEAAWNSLGEENQREGYWVYPSPRWDAPKGRKDFRPDRLISLGLTNRPRITESEPVTNSLDIESPTNNNTATPTIMDRKLLTEKLGLDVTATDEEIMAAIAALQSSAETAKAKETEAATATTGLSAMTTEKEQLANSLTTAKAKIITLETAVQTARESHANSLLDAAETAGRITKAERPTWLPRLTGEQRETEANALGAITPKLNTRSLDVSRSRVEIGDEAQRRESIANAVDTLMTTKGLTYHEAYLAAKKDPALKPVWDAMKTEA